jgi:hypothetical protein
MRTIPRPILLLSLLAIAVISTIIGCSDRGNKPNNPGEDLPPTVPMAIMPSDGATNVPLDFTLEWESSDPNGGELNYKVYIGTDSIAFQDSESVAANEYRSPYGERAKARQLLDQIYSMQEAYYNTNYHYCLNGVSVSAGDSGFYANLGVIPDPFDCYIYTMWENFGYFICTAVGNIDSDTSSDIWQTHPASGDGIRFNCIADDFNYPVEPDRKYFWQVIAFDEAGDSAVSPIYHFTSGSDTLEINGYPSIPVLLTPVDGEVVDQENLVFSWHSTDPDNDSLEYDLYMDIYQDFRGIWYNRHLRQNYQASPWTKRALMKDILIQIYQLETAYHSEHGSYFLDGNDYSYEHNSDGLPGIAIDSLNSYVFVISANRNSFSCTASCTDLDNDATVDVWQITEQGELNCVTDDMLLLLSDGTTYYWRIAAIDQYGHATFSQIKSFVLQESRSLNLRTTR